MFGLSHSPASLPCPASAWWNPPLGRAAGPICQPHTTTQWWGHPSTSTPTWAGPTTHIHFWGEQTAQQMHQALGHQPPIQPLTIMAYPSHQPMPQQHCHCTATPLAQAQPKEQDLLLKCMAQLETAVKAQQEEATNRMTQLETAVKAQQEAANQGSAAMKQYVSEQMAEWRTWKESDEPQPSRKRNKPEPAQVTQHSELPNQKLQAPPQVPRQPTLGEWQADQGTMELEDRPSILQRLTGLEIQIRKQADMGIKRHRPPSQEDQRPAKRTTRSEKAYSDPFGIFDSKQSSPRLAQKNKAQPTSHPGDHVPQWRSRKDGHNPHAAKAPCRLSNPQDKK